MMGLNCQQTFALNHNKPSKMANKENIIGEMMCKKGAKKHCCWGLCNSNSRYVDRLKEDFFPYGLQNQGR